MNISSNTQEQMAEQLPHVLSSGRHVINKLQWNFRLFVRVAETQFAVVRIHTWLSGETGLSHCHESAVCFAVKYGRNKSGA